MSNSGNLLILFTFFLYALSDCSAPKERLIKTAGPEVISYSVLPFELTDVKLLDGPFHHATELDVRTLLSYDPDHLLGSS